MLGGQLASLLDRLPPRLLIVAHVQQETSATSSGGSSTLPSIVTA